MIFLCKLFTMLASGKERRTTLSLKGGEYDVGAKLMEFVLYLPYASKPPSVEGVPCTCRQENERQRECSLARSWYSSMKLMSQGSSKGQHAAASQHCQKGGWCSLMGRSSCWHVHASLSFRTHGHWLKAYKRIDCGGSNLGPRRRWKTWQWLRGSSESGREGKLRQIRWPRDQRKLRNLESQGYNDKTNSLTLGEWALANTQRLAWG